MRKFVLILILISISFILNADNPWLGKDKAAHFTYSAALTYWNYGVAKDFFENSRQNSLIISVNFTALMGLVKEYSDKNISNSYWSWHDIAYDFAGIACGIVLINNLR
jgi:putative lipoprotein